MSFPSPNELVASFTYPTPHKLLEGDYNMYVQKKKELK